MAPKEIPYRNCYIDFQGPFYVKNNDVKSKVYLLVITCMWSRDINLKICLDITTTEFLKALQLHIFEFGVPESCISDLGSQLTAGANLLNDFF